MEESARPGGILSTLQMHVFPRFGTVLVSDVTSADVRQVILAVRQAAPEVARKLVFRVSAVFKGRLPKA
ncbi:phage integrase central domain-containing protein [Shinella sp. BYT-45]|uniref:phage integrase central domain-containing protein n=1 Tax=Shinella sp. BYT-45 TaxID=3377377 RepID=UPI003980E528